MAFANLLQLPCPSCACPGGGGAGGGGGTTNPPNCFCTNVPTVLALRSCNGNQIGGLIQPATLTYGPFPPALTVAGLFGGSGWWSGALAATIPANPLPGTIAVTMYYVLNCNFNQWILNGLWYYTIPPNPLIALQYTVATFAIGNGFNSCSPFALIRGCYQLYTTIPPYACLTIGSPAAAPACYADCVVYDPLPNPPLVNPVC